MERFGWVLFVLGAVILIVSGFIGTYTGNVRVTNLAGLSVGGTLMICGSIFVGVGQIIWAIQKSKSFASAQESSNQVQLEPLEESTGSGPEGIERTENEFIW